MSLPQQVNIAIQTCTDFSKTYTLKNDDGSARDLTNHSFTANLAKHPDALVATETTSSTRYYRFTSFSVSVGDVTSGEFTISLTELQTKPLEEGKYVYSIVMNDSTDSYSEIFRGLVFVTKGFGYVTGAVTY